jgi:CAAX protease family protein
VPGPKVLAAASPADLRKATLGFTAPFVLFIAMMTAERLTTVPPQLAYPLRLGVVTAALLVFSLPYIGWRPAFPVSSVLLGVAVFLVWVGPDLLFDYRQSALFENVLTGPAVSSIPLALRRNFAFVVVRSLSCVVAVPILEELFWRGWLMRWLVKKNFLLVPFGAYLPSAFWTVAILFASEHGAYWEVGLAAGVIYNWWALRTRNLADCILAHSVTNACLSAYVLVTGLWRYWL